jgi:hypothetical protein
MYRWMYVFSLVDVSAEVVKSQKKKYEAVLCKCLSVMMG